jgi:hypothetical protein
MNSSSKKKNSSNCPRVRLSLLRLYQNYRLPEYDAVLFIRWTPTFWKDLVPKPSNITAESAELQATLCYDMALQRVPLRLVARPKVLVALTDHFSPPGIL